MRWTAVIILFLISSSALAQQPAYEPPDRDLWLDMRRAIDSVSMPGQAHRDLESILMQTEKAAAAKSAKAAAAKKADGPPKP